MSIRQIPEPTTVEELAARLVTTAKSAMAAGSPEEVVREVLMGLASSRVSARRGRNADVVPLAVVRELAAEVARSKHGRS
jgi:hypothetical protein